jgi:hypothetical protein
MARKNRNLASFDDLANNNVNKNINNNINDDVNININNNNNINKNTNDNINNDANINVNANISEVDYLDTIIEGNTKKTDAATVLTGIYLQKDLSQMLDRLAKKGGRGSKSRIVKEALRKVFSEKGLL